MTNDSVENIHKEFPRGNARITMGLLFLIVIMGIFFRFYHLKNVFTEVDDVGVVTAHRAVTTDYVLKKNIGSFDVEIIIKKEFLLNLLESPLFFAYLGYAWAYPPGQYIVYPLLLDESDPFYSKIVLGRAPSAILSSTSLVLFVYLLFLINNRKIDASFLIPTAIFSFSFNSVLYAHHMGPTSVTVTTLLISIILFFKLKNNIKKISSFFMWLGVLTWFNYLMIIAVPIFALLLIIRFKIFSIKEILLSFYRSVLVYLFLFVPLWVLFFKPGEGGGRGMGPLPMSAVGMTAYLNHLFQKFSVAGASVFASFSLVRDVNQFVFVFLLILGMFILITRYRSLGESKYIYMFLILYLCIWVVLYCFNRLPMEPSRHVLIWLPGVAMILYLVVSRMQQGPIFHWILLIPLIVFGGFYNHKNITDRLSKFDFSAIENSSVETVILYGGTVNPIVYFENDKKILSLDKRSFSGSFNEISFPDRMLLVAQVASLEVYKSWKSVYWVNNLFDQYEIVSAREDVSNVFFTFDNVRINSMPNNFFIYEVKKRQVIKPFQADIMSPSTVLAQ
jgi:hypothetical protein